MKLSAVALEFDFGFNISLEVCWMEHALRNFGSLQVVNPSASEFR